MDMMKILFKLDPNKEIKLNIDQTNFDEIVKEITAHDNMREFNTAYLRLELSDEYKELGGLKDKDDIVMIRENGDDSSIFFTGYIEKVEISFKDNGGLGLEICAISSFAKLERTYLNQQTISECTGFRKLISKIMEASGIVNSVTIDDDVDDRVSFSFVHNFPALSFLRQLLFQKDLIFITSKDDTMRILKRSNYVPSVAPIPVITAGDPRISSLRITRG
ncbi:MAG: hypothetical protein JNM06_21075 [Blastocatellia bacterium]|nr:hypothetical protein [Blastocatellia bacterium]